VGSWDITPCALVDADISEESFLYATQILHRKHTERVYMIYNSATCQQQRWKVAWPLTATVILWGAEVFCWRMPFLTNEGLAHSFCRVVLAIWLKNGLSSHGSRREVPACLSLLSRLLRQVQHIEPLTIVNRCNMECFRVYEPGKIPLKAQYDQQALKKN
jgi:hypothetical protein